VIDPLDADEVPRDRLLVLATGSQGERRAASAQLAAGKYLGIEMKKGDTFLFSSKTIPGNEVSVGRILNQLSEKGVRTIDDSDGRYHVSGHPNRPDLIRSCIRLIRARTIVPNHGEHRHMVAHAELASRTGRRGRRAERNMWSI
jgi:ribonuclease J